MKADTPSLLPQHPFLTTRPAKHVRGASQRRQKRPLREAVQDGPMPLSEEVTKQLAAAFTFHRAAAVSSQERSSTLPMTTTTKNPSSQTPSSPPVKMDTIPQESVEFVLERRIQRDPRHYDLATLRSMFDQGKFSFPEYQRGYVMKPWQQRLLFFFLVYGYVPDPIRCMRKQVKGFGEQLDVLDGQQRLITLIQIAKNRVKLPDEQLLLRYLPGCEMPLICPGKRLNQLPEVLQNAILYDTTLDVTVQTKVPTRFEPDIYLGYNIGRTSLTVGDQLAARPSIARRVAGNLTSWEEIAMWSMLHKRSSLTVEDRDRNRMMIAMQCLVLETLSSPYYYSFRKEDLRPWAAGLYDEHFGWEDSDGILHTTPLVSQVMARMNAIGNAFFGLDTTARSHYIVMYQAALFLEKDYGFDLAASPRGCLTQWMRDRERVPLSVKYTEAGSQRDVWEALLPLLVEQAQSHYGLVKNYAHKRPS